MTTNDRVVSIYPTSHGFGFSVFEDTTRLDWGHAQVRPAKGGKCLERIIELLAWYDPHIVVVEDTEWKKSRRGDRVKLLLQDVGRITHGTSTKLVHVPYDLVLKTFTVGKKATKHDIAKTVILHYPELEFKLPAPRKIWMSEDERMSIFSASALAMTLIHGSAYKDDVS